MNYVYEYMNPEITTTVGHRTAAELKAQLIEQGLSELPVLDAEGHPLGTVGLGDVLKVADNGTVAECMRCPAAVIDAGTSLEAVGRLLAATSQRRLVVVDDVGHAVGMISALDVVRAQTGMPPRYPLPDRAAGPLGRSYAWSETIPLDATSATSQAPAGPGLFVLIQKVEGQPESVVWAESSDHVAARLIELLQDSDAAGPLARIRKRGPLHFRSVQVGGDGAAVPS